MSSTQLHPQPSRRRRFFLFLGAIALGAGLAWSGALLERFGYLPPIARADTSPASAPKEENLPSPPTALPDPSESIDRLKGEKAALEETLVTLRLKSDFQESALNEALSANSALLKDLTDFNTRNYELSQENESLSNSIDSKNRKETNLRRELEEKVSLLEVAFNTARQEWDKEKQRFAAVTQNLEKQNTILKDRLNQIILARTDLPEGTNADAALKQGSLEIDSLRQEIRDLSGQLAQAAERRNALAASLQQAQIENATAALTIASLTSDAGDRVVVDLTARIEALQETTESAKADWDEEVSKWESEKQQWNRRQASLQEEIQELERKLAAATKTVSLPGPAEASAARDSGAASSLSNRPGGSIALIESPDALSPASLHLFQALHESEDTPNALETLYPHLREGKGCRVISTIAFRSSSANIQQTYRRKLQAEIEALASEAGEQNLSPTSHFLVIGYASMDGSEQGNRNLSSQRAKRVAEALAELDPNAQVESIYFGQTQRFDLARRSPNRVVEVWQLP